MAAERLSMRTIKEVLRLKWEKKLSNKQIAKSCNIARSTKISGAFRSFDALVDFCRICGYVSTARTNGINTLDALRRVFLGDPFIPAVNTS